MREAVNSSWAMESMINQEMNAPVVMTQAVEALLQIHSSYQGSAVGLVLECGGAIDAPGNGGKHRFDLHDCDERHRHRREIYEELVANLDGVNIIDE